MYERPVKITYDRYFEKDVKKLSPRIQTKLSALLEIAQDNIIDNRLHTKSLNPPLSRLFSFRITRDYRVAFIFTATDSVRLLIADRRDKIYKRLAQR
ncbi:MAG: hypothetical protein COU10_02295 [Candidatus Harrisonbacteria bacterium CG10_big_fil_rev_8_21_14_0_10_45_28]|uniref:Type II toxin-antitoxin system RelE/ParE family toxin n=1 Tax=Candidatus Harrisonbacteria bacterium CG10_big_fil_rev_8_21_14_0_10_45_28 TaxID=1974586 RepID=A0A2H0UN94_9BACT|nr:MAG: hypothetical protein COU10_02295 [Candidatus Harrisonbacteria bacterium CG10_big_fil_rev_8_21_14_0_10_45_28]